MELIFKALLFFVALLLVFGIATLLSKGLDWFINFWTSGE